jgi:hypothetical protein
MAERELPKLETGVRFPSPAPIDDRDLKMTQQNEATVRTAYEAYAAGDLPTMLAFIDPELEWTYLDPSLENVLTVPEGRILAIRACRDREEALGVAGLG